MKYKLLSIDLQNDFASEGGKNFKIRPSVSFIKEGLIPVLRERGIKIHEIISDYRGPRPGDKGISCLPGTWGYESIIPHEVVSSQWVKCMNSPIWVRENIGNPNKDPGLPYQDTVHFGEWVLKSFGKPGEATVVLFGLTLDCCVLSTLQELRWHGYECLVLKEGVDHRDGTEVSKELIFKSPLSNWGGVITWEELKKSL